MPSVHFGSKGGESGISFGRGLLTYVVEYKTGQLIFEEHQILTDCPAALFAPTSQHHKLVNMFKLVSSKHDHMLTPAQRFNHPSIPQIATILTIVVAAVAAKPALLAPLAVSAPYVAATSSQVFARQYNGVVAAAPLVAHPAAAVAYTQPIFSSNAATYSAYTTYPHHVAAVHPFAAYHPAVAAPLKYVAAGPVLL